MESMPILQGLSREQFDALLDICKRVELPRDVLIYKEGQQSVDMYFLVEGALVITLWGKELGRVFPFSPVGEMGLFTNESRSTDVATITKCTLLKIEGDDLFSLFEQDKELHVHFQQGIIDDMAHKLRATNEVIATLRSKLAKGH